MSREQTQQLLAGAIGEKYEIMHWLGGGGMADVFLARHRIHGALFAVKVLSADLAQDERIVARFVQEARTAATLSGHPNIVPIFDIGNVGDLYYLVMQYLDGEDLAKYLKQHKKMSITDASNVIAQVADALDWASSKGVVHRDLKPSNLYLTTNGRIIVLDFGIAKAADVPSALTVASERLGTTYYMSPEQIRGEVCDVRSDLYSLGVVFFEFLAGVRPFEGDSHRAIELAHIEKEPPDLRSLDKSIPEPVCAMLTKLLKKDVKDRYQTPKSLIADLTSFQGGWAQGETVLRSDGPAQAPAMAAVATNAAVPKPGGGGLKIVAIVGTVVVVLLAVTAAYLLSARKKAPEPVSVAKTETAAPKAPKTVMDKLGHTFLLVPAGDFVFGEDGPNMPNPRQTVSIGDFYIQRTEVSNASYQKFCEATHRRVPDSVKTGGADLPATDVSFDDAEAFAAWLGERLPSEQEWEKAARGPNGNVYPWGDEAWGNRPTTVQPVTSFPDRASPYGAYDMAGNVFEWTTSSFPSSALDIKDLAEQLGSSRFSQDWRVVKGGFAKANPVFLKTYMRRGFPKDVGAPSIGFRCVR